MTTNTAADIPETTNWKLYHENYVALARALMVAGGDPFVVLPKNESFLVTLANNGIVIEAGVVRFDVEP